MMRIIATFCLISCFSGNIFAQQAGFSNGKNLPQLRSAVLGASGFRMEISGALFADPPKMEKNEPQRSLALLPKWSAENLPFFCKIEHEWGKNARIPLKFRLGSVDYVDWLEGKRH